MELSNRLELFKMPDCQVERVNILFQNCSGGDA